jgi:hypothetical protein
MSVHWIDVSRIGTISKIDCLILKQNYDDPWYSGKIETKKLATMQLDTRNWMVKNQSNFARCNNLTLFLHFIGSLAC